MKRLILVIALVAGGIAHAEGSNWAQRLEKHKQNMQSTSNTMLWVNNAFFTAGAMSTCSMSTVVAAAAFIGDTVPVGNIVSETIANVSSDDYKTFDAVNRWEALGQIGRGAVGGAVVTAVDALKFVVLWLGGQESRSFESAKQVYASTFETLNTVFAREGQCLMNVSRVLITRQEMVNRRMVGFDFGSQTSAQP